ncbi:hypothetical protein V5E97_39605 [Singulisphaera sp. Ch08]|uniref:Uncharacterized protein n=1 Tax=Singulisphaera sp. Ch08 TaxID=3120278 RepID=A0AAU7CGI6_9BACT
MERAAPAIIDQADEGHSCVIGLVGLPRGAFRIGVCQLETKPGEVDVGRPPCERVPFLFAVMSGMVIVGMPIVRGSPGVPMRMTLSMMMMVLTCSFVSMSDTGRRKAASQHEG